MALFTPDLPMVVYIESQKVVGSILLSKDGNDITFLKAPMSIQEIIENGGSNETGSGARVVIRGNEFHAAGVAMVKGGRVWFKPSVGEIYIVPSGKRFNYVETGDLMFIRDGVTVEIIPVEKDTVDDFLSPNAYLQLSRGEYFVYPRIYTPKSLRQSLLLYAGVTI